MQAPSTKIRLDEDAQDAHDPPRTGFGWDALPVSPRGDVNMPEQEISFDADVKPLFREKDRDAMRKAFDLWSYADVQTHATAIAEALRRGSMPCDGAWPPEQVEAFTRWIEQGKPE
jgi:hypothetical protein